MTLDALIIITCAVMTLGCYIYLKASGTWWYGINWKMVAKTIRKLFK